MTSRTIVQHLTILPLTRGLLAIAVFLFILVSPIETAEQINKLYFATE